MSEYEDDQVGGAPDGRDGAIAGHLNISDRAIGDIVGWTVLECYGGGL